jgi:hypothetical protein
MPRRRNDLKPWMIFVLTVLAAGCNVAIGDPPGGPIRDEDESTSIVEPPRRASLPDYGLALELQNAVWLNTEGPLRLADLRGRVVLLEMWTFG